MPDDARMRIRRQANLAWRLAFGSEREAYLPGRHRARISRSPGDLDQDVLWLQGDLRRSPEHPHLPRVPRRSKPDPSHSHSWLPLQHPTTGTLKEGYMHAHRPRNGGSADDAFGLATETRLTRGALRPMLARSTGHGGGVAVLVGRGPNEETSVPLS